MDAREKAAHDALLLWCRGARPQGKAVHPAMRYSPTGQCTVIDLGDREMVPGSTWERRDRRLAVAATWLECAIALGIEVPS